MGSDLQERINFVGTGRWEWGGGGGGGGGGGQNSPFQSSPSFGRGMSSMEANDVVI